MPNKFPGARGLSFYDVCDEFGLPEKSTAPFAVDLSQLLHTGVVPAPATPIQAELRKGEVKVFCPGGLPERTHFQLRVCAEAPALAPTVLHDDSKVHLCVTYDLYLAGVDAVTPLLEMFEDRSRPLVQVQVLFRLDEQDDGLNNLVGFKAAIKQRVDAVLDNQLTAATAVNNPPLLTVSVNKSYNCKALLPPTKQNITKKPTFYRKHFGSTLSPVRNITSIIVSRNLNVMLTTPMAVGHLFPCLQYLTGLVNNEKHRYYTADGSYLKAADIGKRIEHGDPNVKAFYLTLHDALQNLLQSCITFMNDNPLMTAGHFKLCKIAMNHNVNDNFMIAFAWVPGAAPPAVAPTAAADVVTAAAAAATPAAVAAAAAAPPPPLPAAVAATAADVAAVADAAAQNAALVVPAPQRNRVQSTVDAASVSADNAKNATAGGHKMEAQVVVDVVKAIRGLLNVGGALAPTAMVSAKSFVAASRAVLGSIIKLCTAIAADPAKVKDIVKAAVPAHVPATVPAHLIVPIALRTLVNALPPAADVNGAVESAMNAVVTLLKGLTAAVLRAVAAAEGRTVDEVVSDLCPPSPQPVPLPAAAPAAPAAAHVPAPAPGRAYSPVFSIMYNDFFETLQVEANIHVNCVITKYDAIPPTASSFNAFCTRANALVAQTATEFLAISASEPRFVNFGVADF